MKTEQDATGMPGNRHWLNMHLMPTCRQVAGAWAISRMRRQNFLRPGWVKHSRMCELPVSSPPPPSPPLFFFFVHYLLITSRLVHRRFGGFERNSQQAVGSLLPRPLLFQKGFRKSERKGSWQTNYFHICSSFTLHLFRFLVFRFQKFFF